MPGEQIQNSDSYIEKPKKVSFSLVSTLINSIHNKKERLIFRLFLGTGCTPTELINFKHDDFDFSKNILKIRAETTHNNKSRAISLSKKLSLEVKEFGDEKKLFLFSSKLRPQLSKRTLHRIFEKYSAKFGIKIISADLRKFYVKNALGKKEPIKKIKSLTGLKRLDKKDYLAKKEFENIRKTVKNKRDQLIFDILFEAGCTLKELVNIKVKDIKFSKNSVKILAVNTKNKQQRAAAISKKLSLAIKGFVRENRLNPQDCLFSTRQSKTITEERVFQIIKSYSKELSPQVLRYSYIANASAIGKSIEEISKQTGIKNLDKFHLYGTLMTKKIKNE